ncbi:MAG: ABC transporter permease [Pirellulales bacterium]|nr:ABC transporter permease [Pirellulales bacterium]
MLAALDRKMIRDVWHMKGQVLAICLVLASGVAMFILALTALDSLQMTLSAYCDRYRLGHVFAHMKRAPLALVEQLSAIPGVARAEPRITFDATLDIAGMTEPAIGRLISIPETRQPHLNALHLREGRWIEPGRDDEVIISEAFALAQRMHPGDRLVAILNGRRKRLEIVGVALSPEYIYQIRPGDIFPDDKRFGVIWMGQRPMEAVFDMDGAFNDLTISLMPGASVKEVLRRVDQLTEPYGGVGAFDRSEQVSYRFVRNEIDQLQSMAIVVPTIFLSVAAFLLNVVLKRLVSTQREQIAAIKAFGYTHWEVGLHYLKLVLFIVFCGGLLGTAMGAYLGWNLSRMYARFYHFPHLQFQLRAQTIVLSGLIAVAAAVLGTWRAVSAAINLPPAEAMRPEPPAKFRPTVLERLGLQRLFDQPTRMIMRHLEREPIKAALASFGIAMAVAVLVVGNFGLDAVNYIFAAQFDLAQRQDISLTFVEPRPARAIFEAEHLPGVIQSEVFRAVPVRFRAGHRTRLSGIVGLPQRPRLNQVIDDDLRNVVLPPEGVVLSTNLAQALGVDVGEPVTVEILEGERPIRSLVVGAIASQFIGTAAYMEIGALHRFMREGASVSGAYLLTDPLVNDNLYQQLKETPGVASVALKGAVVESFRNTVAENLLRMRLFNIGFASIIAFGVVYNSARIALSERGRELASLRVLGFTRGEISYILLGELAVLTLAALPVGLTIGYILCWFATTSTNSEFISLPVVVQRGTYAFAVLVVLIAALFSGLVVRRRLDHLDLIAVLKTRE